MSIIFGLKRPAGEMVSKEELLGLARTTGRWATEGTFALTSGHVGMGFQPYYTHTRMRLDSLPFVDSCGNMITFDGRLDNHEELHALLNPSAPHTSDSEIIAKAFEKWGGACFSHLVGDWAVALWVRKTNALYLARDHAGARTLYYEQNGNTVTWSSYLEPLVCRNDSHELNRVFVNRYLALLPLEETTPYAGVHAVPAGHYIVMTGEQMHHVAHWKCAEGGELVLRDDTEYEERFSQLFRRSVERRIGGDVGVLGQLSGGMDSTSIVCMADDVRRLGPQHLDLIDTVSFYDTSETSWDDDKYFTIVERFRKKSGIHIRVNGMQLSLSAPSAVYLFPGADGTSEQQEREFNSAVGTDKYRVILSGLGGDEFLGGVPFPSPELASQLLRGRLNDLVKSSVSWGLALRRPAIELLGNTLAFVAEMIVGEERSLKQIFPWIPKREQNPFPRPRCRKLHLPRPFLGNYYSRLLAAVRESLPHQRPHSISRLEYRYPMLDRDLLDFLTRIPRSQLLRPGERRSLMKRAVRGLIPSEILNRRRKAAVSQCPLRAIVSCRSEIVSLFKDSLLESLGFVDGLTLTDCLTAVAQGKEISFYPGIRRAIEMELWLRTSTSSGRLRS
jgi:asparagine synthase (glutamine-hydrolysing)